MAAKVLSVSDVEYLAARAIAITPAEVGQLYVSHEALRAERDAAVKERDAAHPAPAIRQMLSAEQQARYGLEPVVEGSHVREPAQLVMRLCDALNMAEREAMERRDQDRRGAVVLFERIAQLEAAVRKWGACVHCLAVPGKQWRGIDRAWVSCSPCEGTGLVPAARAILGAREGEVKR